MELKGSLTLSEAPGFNTASEGVETDSGRSTRYPLHMGASPRRPKLRSPAGTPITSRSTPATNATSDNPTDDIHMFNHSRPAIPDFLESLEVDDELYGCVTNALSLFTRGYFIEKNVRIVESDKHILHILRHPDRVYTFKDPSPVGAYTVSTDAERDVTQATIASISKQCSPRGVDSPSTAQVQEETYRQATSTFAIMPQRITDVDRQVAMEIQRRCTNKVLAKSMVAKAGNSGRRLVRTLVSDSRKVTTAHKRSAVREFTDRVEEGLAAPSVICFNDLMGDLTTLNDRLVTKKDFAELGEIYVEAARACMGELKTVLLDAELSKLADVTDEDSLVLVAEAIISQLTNIEDDANHARRAAEREGRALAARPDAHKNKKLKKPTADRPERPPWTVKEGPCKYCTKGAANGPNQGHWQSECSLLAKNGGSIDPKTWVKPEAAAAAAEGSAKLARGGEINLAALNSSPNAEAALAALLGGGTSTAGDSGRSLMARGGAEDSFKRTLSVVLTSTGSSSGRPAGVPASAPPGLTSVEEAVDLCIAADLQPIFRGPEIFEPFIIGETMLAEQADDCDGESDEEDDSGDEARAPTRTPAVDDVPMGSPVPSVHVPTIAELSLSSPKTDFALGHRSGAR